MRNLFIALSTSVMLAACTSESDDVETIASLQAFAPFRSDDVLMPQALEISVYDGRVGGMGLAAPGLPLWGTLAPERNLAICVTHMDGETICYPDEELSTSRCPDTERCIYAISTKAAPVAVSVFNVRPLARGFIKGIIDPAKEKIEGSEVLEGLADANERRAFWRASFILDDGRLSASQREELEGLTRIAVIDLAFPKSVKLGEGALSGPFARCFFDGAAFECEALRDTSLIAYPLDTASAAWSQESERATPIGKIKPKKG